MFRPYALKSIVVAGSIALGAIAGGVVAVNASSASVTVCASKANGVIRYAKAGKCRATETKLVLGQEGPVGATGPAGSFSGVVALKTVSGSMQLSLADVGRTLVVTNNATITIAADATNAIAVGTQIDIAQTTGQLTVIGATGVTVNGSSLVQYVGADTYQTAVLLKTATNTWALLRSPL
ncbi:MAG: hypothetical protein WAP25_06630 [Ilumatobacteraceae bacterium]|jgi:hypothetical protein|nr:hypothetical protein [Actinomycetota bacterium]